MKYFKSDLHIHSCLSPCADLDMSPRGIVDRSLEQGLQLICVCDHNSAENLGAVRRAAAGKGLHVLAGMEVSSREEVHTLAVFEKESQALALQEVVYRHLKGTNRPELFGDQVVANEFDEVEGFNDRRLIGAADLSIDSVVQAVHRLGGISIASHVDRQSFSILGQLGFIPPDLELDAVEISARMSGEEARETLPGIRGYPLVRFSDAHFLKDIGSAFTLFLMEHPTLDEIRLALAGREGRKVAL